jgi:hypothetical protein
MIKKLLFLLLAVCTLVVLKPTVAFASFMGSWVTGVQATELPTPPTGLDTQSGGPLKVSKIFGGITPMPSPPPWANTQIECAVNNGLLIGNNGKLNPMEYLTRAEMVTIVTRAFGATDTAPLSNYTDLVATKWYYDEIAKARSMSCIVGFDNEMRPEEYATREEAFVVLARAFKLTGGDQSVLNAFSDGDLVSSWAVDGAASLVAAKYVQGSNGKLNPQDFITKVEMAQLMYVLVTNYISAPGVKTDNLTGNVMIKVPGVTLKNLTITGDLIIGDGVGDGVVILDGVTVTGRIVVRSTATRVIYLNCPLSSDATLIKHAVVKGILLSVGAPDATLESAIGSIATIADGNAADTTNSYFFYTLFRATDSHGVVKVVKYGAGTDTAHFATDAAYANQALTNGDFFIIRVTAGDGTTVLYYKVDVLVPWSPSTNRNNGYPT